MDCALSTSAISRCTVCESLNLLLFRRWYFYSSVVRRIPFAGLCTVHVDSRHRILAGGCGALVYFRRMAPQKSRRNMGQRLAGIMMGLFFCLTLRRTGHLWFAVGFHVSWDWGESFFYSVPDSGETSRGHLLSSSFHGPKWLTGGSVGPEASLLCLVAIAIVWIAFDRVYPSTTRVHSQLGVEK
jgi:hypothetical protein